MSGRHRVDGSGARRQIQLLCAAAVTGACGAMAWLGPQFDSSAPLARASSGAVVVSPGQMTETVAARTVSVPALDLFADVDQLHQRDDGTLQTPSDWADAGWYADGVLPGERGAAIIVGHRDSARDGPAVFYRLPELASGDEVFVDRNDGRRYRFVVDSVDQFPKTGFPTDLVYGPRPDPELRLVTCTGSFDEANRSYRDNLVVSAHLEP